MTLSVLTTEAEMLAFEPEWSALARGRCPFQSPEWLLPWWRQFGTGHPVVATLRDDSRMIGILACTILDEPRSRKLLPIGAGISDYFDALIDAGAPPDTTSRLLAGVLDAATGITTCDLIDLPPGAHLRQAAAPNGWASELTETTPCPVLTVPETVSDLRALIPAPTHRKLRMNRHRAERRGGWTHAIAAMPDVAEAVGALARLHTARWQGGVFADARVLDCVIDAAPRLLGVEALQLHTLSFEADAVAACLALRDGPDRLMLYLSGFDEAHAFESPGTILLAAVIEGAIAAGVREIDFLRGGEAYKYSWGARDRFNATRRLTPA